MTESEFQIDGWDEQPIDDVEPKLTRTTVSKTFTGDLTGTSQMVYAMIYDNDGNAMLTALERIDATIGERTGQLVLRHTGGFADGAATADIEVLAQHGTGDFAGVTGTGSMRADPAGTMTLDLDLTQNP